VSGWLSQPSAWLVDDKLTFLESDGTLCGTASKSLGLKDAGGLASCVDFSEGNLCGTALKGVEGQSNCDNLGDGLCIANTGDDKIVVVKAPKSARCDDAKMLKTLGNAKDEPDLRLAEPMHLVRCIQNNAETWITNRRSNSVTAFHVFDNKVTVVPGSPFHGGGLADPEAIACDLDGRVWIANHARNSNSVTQLEEYSGGRGTTELRTTSPESGFSGVGMNRPYGVAVDQLGNVWVSNEGNDSLTVLIGAGQ
jgi:DNA-binding beta-propeller fold protein YncE